MIVPMLKRFKQLLRVSQTAAATSPCDRPLRVNRVVRAVHQASGEKLGLVLTRQTGAEAEEEFSIGSCNPPIVTFATATLAMGDAVAVDAGAMLLLTVSVTSY